MVGAARAFFSSSWVSGSGDCGVASLNRESPNGGPVWQIKISNSVRFGLGAESVDTIGLRTTRQFPEGGQEPSINSTRRFFHPRNLTGDAQAVMFTYTDSNE